MTVHPHARGADPALGARDMDLITVHPHARGADSRSDDLSVHLTKVHPHARGADDGPPGPRGVNARFIPTHVGRILLARRAFRETGRFIPTHVGRMARRPETIARNSGSSPRTWGGCFTVFPPDHNKHGSSPRTWGGYFPKCSYGWILMNCKPSKSMMVRRGFPYVSMEKPCSLLVE